MALKKLITLRNGTSVNYHRIKSISINNEKNVNDYNVDDAEQEIGDIITLSLILQSYVDENYRNDGLSNVIFQRPYTFNVDRSVVEENNIFEVAYSLLKLNAGFKDAEDI